MANAVVLARGKLTEDTVVIVQRQRDLLEVVGALRAVGGLAHLLHRRQQETNQHRYDGNDDEQLDQRESPSALQSTPVHGFSPVRGYWISLNSCMNCKPYPSHVTGAHRRRKPFESVWVIRWEAS